MGRGPAQDKGIQMDQMMLRFSRFFIRHRLVNLVLIGAATFFFGYKALQDKTEKWLKGAA